MKLDQIEIKGYKSIRGIKLQLKKLNVLIGANGSGKSNFISLFVLLNKIVNNKLQEYVALEGGADTFLFFGSRKTKELVIKLEFGRNGYNCVLVPTKDDKLVFNEELCYYHGVGYKNPYTNYLGEDHLESKLSAQAKAFPNKVAAHVLNVMQDWRLYHFHDTSSEAEVKKSCGVNDNEYLRANASNLSAFLLKLREENDKEYYLIRDTIRLVAPFFDDFILRPFGKNKDKIRLEWREKESDYPFMAYHLSDGTLRFICLATLLLQPKLPTTILIDEPELGLHPYAITMLTELLRTASKKSQIIVSTQSVPLVNQLNPDEVIIVERAFNKSIFKRPDRKEMVHWLNDYGLGDLWEKNVIGGRP